MELFAAAEILHPPAAFPSIASSPPPAANPAPANASPVMDDVVAALEHASMSVKRLSLSASSAAGADASEAAAAVASLRNAHRVIGSFLHQFAPRLRSPSDGAGGDGDELMRDDYAVAVEEADASSDVGDVEEGMSESGMQSKRRRKRAVPASWPAGRIGDGEVVVSDPVDRRRSAMDLIFQFHG